jgi:hypothetical protein
MRYYFHLRKGPEEILDQRGVDVEEGALKSLDIKKIVDEISSGWSGGLDTKGWSVEIMDENGRSFALVPL